MGKTKTATAKTAEQVQTATTATATVVLAAPPAKRVVKEKVQKEPKRVTGVLVYIATTTYNYWRTYLGKQLNQVEGQMIARLVKFTEDEAKQDGNIAWGGYVAVAPENVEMVANALNEAIKAYGVEAVPYTMLDEFRTVEPTPRVRKTKEENAAEA